MATKKGKFVPKKKRTLISEPNWDQLRKASTEEDRENAFKIASDFVHYEVPEKEHLHWMKAWIREKSNWDLNDNIVELPDAYLVPFAKYGWLAVMLGYIPVRHENSFIKNLKPFLIRSNELRNKLNQEPQIHPTVSSRDPEDFLHPDKVKKWLDYWTAFIKENSKNIETASRERRIAFQTANTYVWNMRNYLRTGTWSDDRFGEKREGKVMVVCKALAYNAAGEVKRSKGTWYPDIQAVWEGATIV